VKGLDCGGRRAEFRDSWGGVEDSQGQTPHTQGRFLERIMRRRDAKETQECDESSGKDARRPHIAE
jgi:hypothetical protein